MNIEVRVENDNTAEIKAKVQAGITRALESSGLLVVGFASAMAPYDTGNLSGSINHRVSDKEVTVGTNVYYGKFQELGTYKMAAHPFLRPAIQNNIGAIKSVIAQSLK